MNQPAPKKPDISALTGKVVVWEEANKRDIPNDSTGADIIAGFVKHLPSTPGVYRMFNTQGEVLYVGKAKSLKNRVSSYTRLTGHSNRIQRMISNTVNMEFVQTNTESEALLLEANLIKRYRPRHNVLLRDDKSFPYIVITDDHESPAVYKHRGARSKKRDYFGPFASGGAVNRTLNAMQRVFLLRTCTNSVYESRTRPCLLYQIKRCSGPCTGEISAGDYGDLVKDAKRFLTGKSSKIHATLSKQMQAASDEMNFERAAVFRDRISALSAIQGHQVINPKGVDEADVFAISQKDGAHCVQVFFYRTGQNWGNRAYFPRADKEIEPNEILTAFMAQFYEDRPCPREIFISCEIEEQDLLAEALTLHAEHKVSISTPKRGKKLELVKHAEMNAREALARKLSDTATQEKLLEGVAKAFGLDEPPQRVEVYDNSHIMGTNAVGAMIVAGPEGFVKNQYRKFNFKNDDLTPGDDYAMMQEVITRRFSRLIKENGIPDDNEQDEEKEVSDTLDSVPWPDLLLIDGGLGQLNAVLEVLRELGIENKVPVVGIAKGPDRDAGREKFIIAGKPAFMLPERDPVLFFTQRLRDEAHRFAIGSHRVKRKKNMVKNPLDEIGGIGPARKRALLHHFGTAKAVEGAALVDLKAVEGISVEIAQTIYNHFHENS